MAFPFFGGNKLTTENKLIRKFNSYKQERETLEAEMDRIAAQTLNVTKLMGSGRIPKSAGNKELTELKAQMRDTIKKAIKVNKILTDLLLKITQDDIKSIGEEE